MNSKLLSRTLMLAVPLAALAVAQPDPPGRVARLNLADGAVSMLTPAAGTDWIPAQLNYPLTTGDQVWTDVSSRAELHIGSAAIRLRSETSLAFTALDDQAVQVQLVSGGLFINVRRLFDREVFEVDTPNLAFTINRPGQYRIEVDGNQTRVIVWDGSAEVSGSDRTLPLSRRDQAIVSGDGRLSYTLVQAPDPDDFDRWAMDRDRRSQRGESARYVSADVIGYEDLDANGAWTEVPNYGRVWTPRVDPGWAPYKFGHWVWIDPWGWTWVDDAPWGFAPFHYGRWAFVAGAWVWVPGPPAVRPVYSPALVAWVGGGGGLRISASIGVGLAWFALGPGEVFVPSYRVSPTYVHRVNVSNTVVNQTTITNVYNTTIVNRTNVTNVTYVNQSAPGAVVGMSHTDMAAGRRGAAVALQASAAQNAPVTPVAPVPVMRPVMQAQPPMRGGGGPVSVSRPSAAIGTQRPVVMRNRPMAARERPVFAPANASTPAPAPAPAAPAPAGRPAFNRPEQPTVREQAPQQPQLRPEVNAQPQNPVTPSMRRQQQQQQQQQQPVQQPPPNPVEQPQARPVQPQPRPERVVERPREPQPQPQTERRPEPRVERAPVATPPPPPVSRPAEPRPEIRPEVRREEPRREQPRREERKQEEKKAEKKEKENK